MKLWGGFERRLGCRVVLFGVVFALLCSAWPICVRAQQQPPEEGASASSPQVGMEGRVTDENNAVVAGAKVTVTDEVTGKSESVTTDANGEFNFRRSAPGRYEIRIEKSGFAPLAQKIIFDSGRMSASSFVLRIGDVRESVNVESGGEGYAVEESAAGTKVNLALRDVPQSIQVVNRQVLDDRATFDFAEAAAQNVAGVTRSMYDITGAGISSAVAVRGFNLNYNNNYLRDGIKFPNYGVSETADLEAVEVLKGPASVLYGRAEPGGIVNLVTKKPLDRAYYSAQFTGGRFDFFRPQLDVGGPLNRRRTLLIRFNAAGERAQSFRDDIKSRRLFFAPVVTWQPRDDTSLKIGAEYFRDLRVADYGLLAVNGRPADVPISRNYGEPFNRSYTQARRFDAVFRHQLTDKWSIQSAYHADLLALDLFQALPTFFEDSVAEDGRTVKRMLLPAAFPEEWQYSDTNVNGVFDTGRVRHNVVLGFEGGYQKVTFSYDFYLTFTPTDLYQKTPPISLAAASAFLQNNAPDFIDRSVYRARTVSGYVQDLITFTPKFKALVGVRYDDYNIRRRDNVAATTTNDPSRGASPRLGFVYQPNDALSFYASYARSLGRSFPNRFTQNGAAFKPLRGEQYEAGVKANAFDDRLTGTLAFFHLGNLNLPAPDPANPGFSLQTGRQRSKGVELDVAARPRRNLNLIATYAFTQPQIVSGDAFSVGNFLPNAARHTGNLWATYEIEGGAMRGLGFGGGVQAVGRRYTNLENSILLPSYARADATAFYTINRTERTNYRLQFNLQNVFDRRYYEAGTDFGSYIFAGAPRVALATFRITRR